MRYLETIFGSLFLFFYDILIYNKSEEEHLAHLGIVFELLRAHQLYLKKSKCSFVESHVAYLSHIISHAGVTVDPEKIHVVHDWPHPQSCSALRGFLDLDGNYHIFIQNYGPLAAPLTSLLKKNSFIWNDEATQSFEALKLALAFTPSYKFPILRNYFWLSVTHPVGALGLSYSSSHTPMHISASSWQHGITNWQHMKEN
ncbi:uncharacterized mitochondrial protein AtMg00860-like [Aristolochia californica]|uniref:uncharacterized mitochondrial protein AtMg00860-like n=1 Tax=Aristolochia californica TaxID=171875 RepID=UPI0035D55837